MSALIGVALSLGTIGCVNQTNAGRNTSTSSNAIVPDSTIAKWQAKLDDSHDILTERTIGWVANSKEEALKSLQQIYDVSDEQVMNLNLKDTNESGVNVEHLLNQKNIKLFITPYKGQYIAITRESLETMWQANIIAAKELGTEQPPELILTGSTRLNMSSHPNSNEVLLELPMLANSQFSQLDVILTMCHEVGHCINRQQLGYEAYNNLSTFSDETIADSLVCLGLRDYAGYADLTLDFLEIYGEYEYNENSHPPNLTRIKQSVRMFAHDKTLSLEERTKQFKAFEAVNERMNSNTEVKFDLMQYYHAEFAKANGLPQHIDKVPNVKVGGKWKELVTQPTTNQQNQRQ